MSIVASEWSRILVLVVFVFVLNVHIAELAEDEVTRASEEETFGWELVLLRECNSHCDVVFAFDSTYATPELKLLKLSLTGFI